MPTLDEILARGGELDPALKQSRMRVLFGDDYRKYITPQGDFEFPFTVPQGPIAPDPAPTAAPFTRGMLSTGSDLLNAGGLLFGAIGAEDWGNAMYAKAQDYTQRANAIPRRVGRVEDIHSPMDAAIYGYETLAEQVPMLASLLLPGGVTSLGARALGASANVARAAGWTAAAVTDLGLQTGESVQIARDNGQDPEDIRVIGSGLGKAFLDLAPVFTIAKRLGIGATLEKTLMTTLAEQGYIKRAAGHVTSLIATEVPTEVAQEAMNIALEKSLTNKEFELTEDDRSALINAAAGAFTVSLGLGGAAGLSRPSKAELHSADDAAEPIATSTAPRGPQMTTDVDKSAVPTSTAGEFETGPAGLSYSAMFNEKTGEMTVTGKEYKKLLIENGRQIRYDPAVDGLVGFEFKPGLQPSRTGWEFDNESGGYSYDQGKAKITIDAAGFTATLDGQPLGSFPAPELAMREAEKYAYDAEPITGVDLSGNYQYKMQSPEKQLARALKRQPQLTPTEQAIVKIEDSKPRDKVDTWEVESDEIKATAQLDPGMQKLLEARLEAIGNKDNFRTTDGQMKNSAKKMVEGIDVRIEKLAEKLGIDNPLKRMKNLAGEKTEEIILDQNQEESGMKQFPNLSQSESAMLVALEEKEREPGGGLTEKEYEHLERLIAKRSKDLGVPEEERIKQSADEAKQAMEALKKVYRREYETVKRKKRSNNAAGSPKGYVTLDGSEDTEEYGSGPEGIVQRKGVDVGYIVKPQNRFAMENMEVENPDFVRDKLDPLLTQVIDKNEGFWAFVAKKGAIPLGHFKSMEAAEAAIVEEDLKGRKDYSRAAGAAFARKTPVSNIGLKETMAKNVSPERKKLELEIIKAVRKIYDSLALKPRITFANSWNKEIFAPDTTLGSSAENYGAFIQFRDGGHIYMVLDNLKSVKHAQVVFIHEVVAHFGLRAFFDQKQLETFLREVIRGRAAEVEQHRQAYANAAKLETSQGNLSLMDAEEFIASKFEVFYLRGEVAKTSFLEKIMNLIRRFGRAIGFASWTDKELANVFRDVGTALRTGITPNNPQGYWWSDRKATQTMGSALGEDIAKAVQPQINTLGELWRAKAATLFLTPLQISERFNVEGAKSQIETISAWWARKRTLTNGAVEVADTWRKVPSRVGEKFADLLLEARVSSDEVGRRLTPEELRKMFTERGLGKDSEELYAKVDSEFQAFLSNLEKGLKFAVLRQSVGSRSEAEQLLKLWGEPDKNAFLTRGKELFGNLELGGRLRDIEEQMNMLRNRNYFPFMRFGSYAVTVRARKDLNWEGGSYNGPTLDKRGQVVHFETSENATGQRTRFEELQKRFPAHLFSVKPSVLSDAEFAFMGMPPALLDLIKNHVELDERQTEQLKELFYVRSPGRAFLRHLVKSKGVSGYSQEALRVFSSYMMNGANHIARIEYSGDMADNLSTMKRFAEENGNVAGVVSNYFQKHYDYIMNPKNDLAQLRALGFLWYLGFNVKSAMVNLTQVPMVAYPYLASVYGDAKAVGALANAYRSVVDWRRGKAMLAPEMEAYVRRGIAEGFLDESRATELAGLAEGGSLHRILPIDKSTRVMNNASYYGSYLFRHAEKFNREVVFIASLELSKQKGLTPEESFKRARKAVQTTMFEYAKWNRPEFMRGNKSVFFLFWNYMQHLNYIAFGGEGKKAALRTNLMLLMVAGLQGLPFAENILDIIDWGSTEVKELFGIEDPKTDLRTSIRELAQTITDRPDLVMHGLSRYYGLGALHLLESIGVPVPQVDISGSLSAGQPIPGIGELVEPSRDPDKKLGAALIESLGPVAGIGYTFWKGMTSQDPDSWKVWERAMPTAIKMGSQATRRMMQGEETFRGGGAIEKFDPANGEHRAELAANALGFQPTRLNQSYDLRSAQEELKAYWLTRRALVMENYAWAVTSQDKDAMKDAKDALDRFNKDAISPKLRLTGESIQKSLRERLRKRTLREDGLPSEKAFVPLYREMGPLYKDSE